MKCVGLVTSKGRDAIRANLVILEPIKRDQLTIYLSAIIPESVKTVWREIDLLKRPTGRYFYDEEVTNAPDKSAARGRPANTQTKEEEVGTPLQELQEGERGDQDTTRPLPPPLPHAGSRQGVRPGGEEDQTGVDGVSSGLLLKPPTEEQTAKPLSFSMKKVLRNLRRGDSYDVGFHGQSQMGGLSGTMTALTRRGLVKQYKLTPAGRKIAKTL